jgi:hypothetical protein
LREGVAQVAGASNRDMTVPAMAASESLPDWADTLPPVPAFDPRLHG